MAISGLDLSVIIIYLLGIMAIGIWVGYRKNASIIGVRVKIVAHGTVYLISTV